MPREQVLFTIIKLDTKFICDNGLKIENYTLKQAAKDGNLVSVGDNILFDRIRNYNKDTREYRKIFEDVQYLRKALRRAKNEGNMEHAKLINRALLKNLYVPEIVNVKSSSKSQFRRVAKDGFMLNGKKYVTFTAGAGQLRRETVTFIAEELYEPMFQTLVCGIDKKITEINVPKFSAYFALTASSVMWVDTPRCCVIKDFNTEIRDQKIDWIAKDENGVGYVKERTLNMELNSCDGQGLISPEFAKVWADNMGLTYVPSQFVARSAYIKGNFCVFDFHEYAKRHGITKITDRYGVQYNLEDIDCLLSESQFKMYKYYSSWQEYQSYVQKAGIKWGIARYNKSEDPEWSMINYQFIQLLDLSDDELKELVDPTVNWINRICSGDKTYAMLYCLGEFERGEGEIEFGDVYTRAQNLAMKAVVKNINFLDDCFVQRKIYENIVTAIDRAKIGKIWARGNYQFMISDPIAQCRSALGMEPTGSIPANHVYSNFWNRLGKTGQIVLGRNPCIDEHELAKVELFRDAETDYWLRYAQSGIILSIYDTVTLRIEDADFDGDIIWSTDNDVFLNNAKTNITNVISYDKPKAPSGVINHQNIVEGYINGFGSKVGVYSNHATSIEAMKAAFDPVKQKAQIDELEKRKKLLREVVGAEIDSTKGLKKPKEPAYFTTPLRIEPEDDDMTKAEKYAHNALVVSKKPYFFRYLYAETNETYKRYEATYNTESKARFNCKLKEILKKRSKTPEEKRFCAKYYRNLPVIDTRCTMNRLCGIIESIDFDIKWNKNNESALPYLDGMEINPDILAAFKSCYQRFCNRKVVAWIDDTDELDIDDDVFEEVAFQTMDQITDQIIADINSYHMSTLENLTYIKELSKQYANFNWGFAWNVLGDAILPEIAYDSYVPVRSEQGVEYFNKKFELERVVKESVDYGAEENE